MNYCVVFVMGRVNYVVAKSVNTCVILVILLLKLLIHELYSIYLYIFIYICLFIYFCYVYFLLH